MSDWSKMKSWDLMLPPSRPTNTELERIRRYCEKLNKNEPIGILGSTPEFRELTYRMGFKNVYVFDKSPDFYLEASEMIPIYDIKAHENLVIGEWTETVRCFQDFFGIILSDLTLGNVHYEKQSSFFLDIYKSLACNGAFIDKVLVLDFEFVELGQILEKYEKLPITMQSVHDFSCETLFCSTLVKETGLVDTAMFYPIIEKYSYKISQYVSKAKLITPEGFIWYYGKSWEEIDRYYRCHYRTRYIYPDENPMSVYFHRTKQFFNIK